MTSAVVRKSILFIGVLLFVANLFVLDYEQFWSRSNIGIGLVMVSNLLIIAAMIISLRHTAKKEREAGKDRDH